MSTNDNDMTPQIGTLTWLLDWLPAKRTLSALSIGCSIAAEAGPLLASGHVRQFVGVDLDETAILAARQHWPQATFIVGDAAQLGTEHNGRYDVVLIRRPDLFAQPERWRRVFERLATLLAPQSHVLVTLIGNNEAALAHEWLAAHDLPVAHAQDLLETEETQLLISKTLQQESEASKEMPDRPKLEIIQLDDPPGKAFYCDPKTGLCYIDGKLAEDNELSNKATANDSTHS